MFRSALGLSTPALSRLLADIDSEIAARRNIEPLLHLLDQTRRPLYESLANRFDPVAAKALTVKILNLCLGKYHFLARSTTLLSRPYGLVVDPINNCNLACPGCVHSSRAKELELFQWTSGLLSEERYAALLDAYGPAAIHITLCNYGEPLLNFKTPDFIRLAKRYLMRTTVSTNMTAPRFNAAAWAASGLDFMTLSIDGATQGVYEKYRRKGHLDVVFRNIRSLVEARRDLGKRTPVLSWQFLAFEHNAHEIDMAIGMARDLGVDQLTVATPFDVSWDDPAIKPANVEPRTIQFGGDSESAIAANWNPFPEDLGAAAIERDFEIGWAARLPALPEEINRRRPETTHTCHWLYKNMVMDATGRVIPCCAAPRPDADLVFSNFDASGAESFNTEKHRLARLSFADKEAYRNERRANPLPAEPHCTNCDWYSDQEAAVVDRGQVESYFRAIGEPPFDGASRKVLASW